jgi:hypothetical protein
MRASYGNLEQLMKSEDGINLGFEARNKLCRKSGAERLGQRLAFPCMLLFKYWHMALHNLSLGHFST